MGKQHQTVLILGEGPTEFYYFKSLADMYKRLTIKPDYPKHTNLKELEEKIAEGISMGYSYIFCIIDMDTKDVGLERIQYQRLKTKYSKPINKPKRGICCQVEFFETHRCTELFFLYYFCYTSRPYPNQDSMLKNLNKCVEYKKSIEFFNMCKGLHNYFERNGGSLTAAIKNANNSIKEKLVNSRDYTYSELGRLIELIENIDTPHIDKNSVI